MTMPFIYVIVRPVDHSTNHLITAFASRASTLKGLAILIMLLPSFTMALEVLFLLPRIVDFSEMGC